MTGFVFLGPTLHIGKAHELLPNAILLPPVNGGDVLSLLKYNPTYLALIDGNFGTRPSVLHKEILFALANGCAVLGASSMGALRAAELHEYGVVGVGQVFEWYRDGHIVCDDEVALIHGPEETGYMAMSTALVDFRYALRKGIERGIVSESVSRQMFQLVKERHFADRTWDCIAAELSSELGGRASADKTVSMLRSLSVKRADAEKLLSLLSQDLQKPSSCTIDRADLLTSSMTALIGRTLSRPVSFSGDWVCKSDLFGRNLRFLPAAYFVTSIVARLLSLASDDTDDLVETRASEVTTTALQMYVQLQVAQGFPSSEIADSSRFASTMGRAFQRAGRLLTQYLSKAALAGSVTHKLAAKHAMLASLSRLATRDSPDIRRVIAGYGLDLTDLAEAVTIMLNLELFVLSYQGLDKRVPDLSVDWWGQAMQFLDFHDLSVALGEASERRSRARALLDTQPRSYHLIRFGFRGGAAELSGYA
jgi:hypothetical protein